MPINFLYTNCRGTWPHSVCVFANFCGYISTAIWFFVLAPQIRKNWKRQSVEGLSILWATANFTASIVNCFFAFSITLPLYLKVSAVYMPVLEILILVQFWFYSKHDIKFRLCYGLVCFVIWIAIITLELFVDEAEENFQWIAIVLWSIESFPQVILNMHLRTTGGQATLSVVLGLMGKTADFLSNYLLLLPSQYVVMTYFSSTLAYINGIQVIWYPKPQPKRAVITSRTTYGSQGSLNEDALEANDCDQIPLIGGDTQDSIEVDRASDEELASVCTVVRPTTYQLFLAGCLLPVLVVFSVCICVNTQGAWGIFAPIVVVVVLFCALLYRNYREGRFHFADSLLAWLHSCCADQPVQSTWVPREQPDGR